MHRLREVVGLERLDKHATCSVFACKDSKFSNVQIFLASRLRCRTWSMMWTLTATVTECVSFMLLGSGSCGTWSWRPGAFHDVHIFSFDLNIHRCHPRARRWYRLFDFFICCLDRINLGNNNSFDFSLRVQVQVERKALVGRKTRVRRKARVRR